MEETPVFGGALGILGIVFRDNETLFLEHGFKTRKREIEAMLKKQRLVVSEDDAKYPESPSEYRCFFQISLLEDSTGQAPPATEYTGHTQLIVCGATERDGNVLIHGWQLSARGYPWLDAVCALGVAAMILYLAYRLFRDAVPVLVDEIAIEPELLVAAIRVVPGVIDVPRVRSRWVGTERAADVIVTVDAALSTGQSHEIADAVEAKLTSDLGIRDITVHVEPHTGA